MKQEKPSSARPPAAISHWCCGYFLAIFTVNITPNTCGKNAGSQIIPIFQLSVVKLSSIHDEMVGSKNANATFDIISAPAQTAMYGSIKRRQIGIEGGFVSVLAIRSCSLIGFITSNSMAPSMAHTSANIRNGTSLPANWYNAPPNGGATKQPKLINANAMPNARDRSFSSVNRSAIIAKPDVSANAEPTPCSDLAKNRTV